MPFPEADLRRALDAGEFYPVFQPLVELRTGQLAGFEVLARWKPQGAGIMEPAAFIPEIEQAGLMNELTAAILSQAFACAAVAERPLMLASNFSATQLLDPRQPGDPLRRRPDDRRHDDDRGPGQCKVRRSGGRTRRA